MSLISKVNSAGERDWRRIPAAVLWIAVLIAGCRSAGSGLTAQQGHALRSLLGRPLSPLPPGPQRESFESKLAAARSKLAEDPEDPEKWILVGRCLGYLWQVQDAIDVYTEAIQRFPDHAPLYRHRGHRYLSARRFEAARHDLERAAALIAGKPDVVEPDGLPNARQIPLTTLSFNVWYHLALARYFTGEFEGAAAAWQEALGFSRNYDDNVAAVSDWMYLTLRKLGRDEEAAALLAPIHSSMDIIENHAYHRRLLLYKGELRPEELIDPDRASDLDLATYGYGLGTWRLLHGDGLRARDLYERVVAGPYWPAFGFIAAEVELDRMRKR